MQKSYLLTPDTSFPIFDSQVFLVDVGEYPGLSNSLESITKLYKSTKGIILMPTIKQYDDSILINEKFLTKIIDYRDKFYPFLYLHPIEIDPVIALVDEFKPCGIKIHPSISQTTIDDPSFSHILEYAEDLNLPVMVHSGRGEKSRFKYIKKVIEKYSNPFLVAHLGGLATELVFDTLSTVSEEKLMSKHDNLYFITSCVYNPKVLRKAISTIGTDRLIFGSDEPYHDYYTQVSILYTLLVEMGFGKTDIEKVFHTNVSKLIGVEQRCNE